MKQKFSFDILLVWQMHVGQHLEKTKPQGTLEEFLGAQISGKGGVRKETKLVIACGASFRAEREGIVTQKYPSVEERERNIFA